MERILITLLGSGDIWLEVRVGEGSCAETIYCSLRMSLVRDE